MNKLLLRFLQSCNPQAYSGLAEERLRLSFRAFFAQFAILFLIMAVLFVPAYFLHAASIESRLASFTMAELDGEFSAPAPVVLLEKPRVIFDEDATSATGAQIVFGDGAVFYKRYYWFGHASAEYASLRNLGALDARLVVFLALFLWPSLVFWSGAYVLAKTLLLAFLFSFLGWLLVGSFKQKITFGKALQVALFAAVPAMAVELLLFPYWRSAWSSFALYFVLFVLGMALLSERKLRGKGAKSS